MVQPAAFFAAVTLERFASDTQRDFIELLKTALVLIGAFLQNASRNFAFLGFEKSPQWCEIFGTIFGDLIEYAGEELEELLGAVRERSGVARDGVQEPTQ